jgi:mannose-1-phosphate guanylyltransferase
MSAPFFIAIIAGGKGERFWPHSRSYKPKHLLPIVGSQPLLRQTLERVLSLVPPSHLFIITSAQHTLAVQQLCPEIPAKNIIGEPQGKDTAAATALAWWLAQNEDPRATLAILPADHAIGRTETYQKALQQGLSLAQQHPWWVTLGVRPSYPATGYGYMQHTSSLAPHAEPAPNTPPSPVTPNYTEPAAVAQAHGPFPVRRILRFVEKPSLEDAQIYLQSGQYYWNAGTFIVNASTYAQSLQTHLPAMWEAFQEASRWRAQGLPLQQTLKALYPKLPQVALDYAILEKTDNIVAIEAPFTWDDVGTWLALERHYPSNTQGNCCQGTVVTHEAHHNLIVSTPEHLVGVIGIDNLVVVHTDDATLICPKEKMDALKPFLAQLKGKTLLQHWL